MFGGKRRIGYFCPRYHYYQKSAMNLTIFHILLLLMPSSVIMAQRNMVVVNVESKVPIRDVRICTDAGQETRTSWDGSFVVPDSFLRIDFLHPDFERRYMMKSEVTGDTVFLIPNTNALHEVVIYGERRFEKRMAQILKPSPQQIERDKMPKYVPAGISPLGMLVLIYNLTLRKKVEDHARRKKALKEVRMKEEEFKQKWDSLKQLKPARESETIKNKRRLKTKKETS